MDSWLPMICGYDSVMTSMIRKLLAAKEVPVSVMSTMASTSSGTFTSVEPQLNSTLALTPRDSRKRVVKPTASVAMRFPCTSFTDWIGELLRYDQDPARRARGGFAILEFSDQFDVGVVLFNPILAGNSAIQIAMLDISADFLGSKQPVSPVPDRRQPVYRIFLSRLSGSRLWRRDRESTLGDFPTVILCGDTD